MKRLEQLPQIAEKGLAGLQATPGLKYRILQEAEKSAHPKKRFTALTRAVCAAAACALALVIALPSMINQENTPLIDSRPLGNATDAPMLLSDNGISGGNVNSSARSVPGYTSIWAENGASFPLIGVNGRYYRMLTTPASASGSLLGGSLGSITQYTTEPALAGANGLMSNVCAAGTTVYEISGMGGAMVAADVNGSMRLFQRVSFNGSALMGSERLTDTLKIGGRITKMELSGIGTVTDRSACERLANTLLNSATFASTGSVSANQTLLISLDNGLTLQLAVKNDKLSACGTWSCPEFFDAFNATVQ